VHVLHTTPYFAPAFGYGGPPRSILALCHAQQQAGIDVEVYTTTANVNDELPTSASGTVYEAVAVKYFRREAPRWLLRAPSMRTPLITAAGRANAMHVHTLFNATSWLAGSAARQTGCPLVLSPRGMLTPAALKFHAVRKRAAWGLFDRRTVEAASVVHASSESEAQMLRTMLPQKRIVEIPNAVEFDGSRVTPAVRQQARAAAGLPGDRRFVFFLGRLHPLKRLDLLAAAFLMLAARCPDVDLVLAGDGSPSVRRDIEAMLRSVSARVRWVAAVGDIHREALLLEASALVLCSDTENFGMSVAEALAAGLPVVVTRTCPWRSVADSGAGLWVEQSGDAIADALQQIMDDPLRAAAMGDRGRALAARVFSLGAVGRRWAEVYQELAAGPA
jgi:glycosyltransferase involved in cell wall biosynthesis